MRKLLILLFVLFAFFASLFYYQSVSKNKPITPLALSNPPGPEISEVSSIEGTMKLTMTKKENSDKTVSYSFSVLDQAQKATNIFSKTTGGGETMALHHNSWSPNNKYVIIEDKVGGVIEYLVFKSNGELFTSGEKYFNATSLFIQKVKTYTLKEMTGWDDPFLIHVLTVKGPPFWFDVTTQSFIQLVR